jgi:queuine/archaeosine tRNA-ribosyltransferase
MRLDSTKKDKDKVEITKQQQVEIQKVFESRIIPHANHTLFEFNVKKKTIEKAEVKPQNTTIHWFEALEKYHKKIIKKVNILNANTVTKAEVIKKDNCIYISALNKENVIKILERDFGIACL